MCSPLLYRHLDKSKKIRNQHQYGPDGGPIVGSKEWWEEWNNWGPPSPPKSFPHPDPWHEFDDLDLCEQAARTFRNDPRAKNGVRFECFNKSEADKLKEIMEKLYPDVITYFSYPGCEDNKKGPNP